MTEDGRMRCIYCGRYFTQDRIDKHQSICGNLKSARPRGVDGEQTQTTAKVFDAKAARTGSGPAYVSPAQYEKRQEKRAEEIKRDKEQQKSKSTWRYQHSQFVEACRAGRGEEEDEPAQQLASRSSSRPRQHNDGKIPCPHCERRFDPTAAERHIPICAKVQNKPRAPPSASPSRTSPGQGHPPRPPSSSGLSPPSARRTKAASSSPKPRSRDRSEPPVELPALNSTMRTTAQSNSSSGSSRGFTSGGTGMQAARSLKRLDSTSRLPGVDKTSRNASNDSRGSRGASPSRKQSERIVTHSEEMDQTILPDDDADGMQSQLEVQQDRLDAQRSAMMLRLLRQVPPETVKQELTDMGVSCADLDKEAMVQAMVKQLA